MITCCTFSISFSTRVFAKSSPSVFQPVFMWVSIIYKKYFLICFLRRSILICYDHFIFYAFFHLVLVSAEAGKLHMLFFSASKRGLFCPYCFTVTHVPFFFFFTFLWCFQIVCCKNLIFLSDPLI